MRQTVFQKRPMGWNGMGWDCRIPLGALAQTLMQRNGWRRVDMHQTHTQTETVWEFGFGLF